MACFLTFNKINKEISSYADEKLKNKIVEEYISPDGKYRALILDNSGGATTYFSYQLLLFKANEPIEQKDEHIVFISDSMFDVKWEENRIIITNFNGKVYKNIQRAKGMDIVINAG